MKTLLLDLDLDAPTDGRLDCALDIARAFGSHVIGLQVTPFAAYAAFDPFGGVFTMVQVMDALAEGEEKIRAAFESRMRAQGLSWEYRHIDGLPSQSISHHSLLADLTIVGKPGEGRDGRSERIARVGELVMSSVSPVLAIPPEASRFDPFGSVLILWNGSPEAATALRGALPLLALASQAMILMAEEPPAQYELPPTGAAEYLSRHGIRAEFRTIPVRDADVASTLLWDVADLAPAYVVMGAYGHSRAREWVFGGVTRRLLCDLPVPLLMAH